MKQIRGGRKYMKNNENIGHKIVDAALVMNYICNKLLTDGDNPEW